MNDINVFRFTISTKFWWIKRNQYTGKKFNNNNKNWCHFDYLVSLIHQLQCISSFFSVKKAWAYLWVYFDLVEVRLRQRHIEKLCQSTKDNFDIRCVTHVSIKPKCFSFGFAEVLQSPFSLFRMIWANSIHLFLLLSQLTRITSI